MANRQRLYQTIKAIQDSKKNQQQNTRQKFPKPQDGPQTAFYNSNAKIVIYGGAAGGGKTAACLIDAARYLDISGYGAVFFRRTYPEIFNQGGLWDNASDWYPLLEGNPARPLWRFPNNCKISFHHLQHEKDVSGWLGAQLPRLYFDQLETFTERQFWMLIGRCRTTLPITPQIRCTCNPDAESFVAKLIDWWIGDDGFPIQSRSGVVRWFVKHKDDLIWENDRDALENYVSKHDIRGTPNSFTFIPATVADNKILLESDSEYVANLEAQHELDRQRLLLGNWKIKPVAGKVFNRGWFDIIDTLPEECYSKDATTIRFWDLAATKTQISFYTAGVKMIRTKINGSYHWFILDAIAEQENPAEVLQLIVTTARQDGELVSVGWEQEPGSAGVMVASQLQTLLKDFVAKSYKPTGDKIQRALPLANQASRGCVHLLRGEWNDRYLSALHNFDGSAKPLVNDLTDASSGGYHAIQNEVRFWGSFGIDKY